MGGEGGGPSLSWHKPEGGAGSQARDHKLGLSVPVTTSWAHGTHLCQHGKLAAAGWQPYLIHYRGSARVKDPGLPMAALLDAPQRVSQG